MKCKLSENSPHTNISTYQQNLEVMSTVGISIIFVLQDCNIMMQYTRNMCVDFYHHMQSLPKVDFGFFAFFAYMVIHRGHNILPMSILWFLLNNQSSS